MVYNYSKEKNMEDKDYLYRNNKYADSSKVILDKGYIARRRLAGFIRVIIFFVVLLLGMFLYIKVSKPTVKIDNKKYTIVADVNQADIGDEVLFTYKKSISTSDRFKLPFNSLLGNLNEDVARVLVLPEGINPETGQPVDQNTLYIECISSNCKGQMTIISTDRIYGVVKGVK